MYFNVSDAIIYDGSSPTVYLRVCYYDSPGGLIQPRYDSTSGAYTNTSTVNFTGTNTWKEATWELTNCKFANSQVVSADFSLYLGTSQNIYIDKVTVSKMPPSHSSLRLGGVLPRFQVSPQGVGQRFLQTAKREVFHFGGQAAHLAGNVQFDG